MKKTLSNFSLLCAACSLLAASAWAQTAPNDKPMTDQNSPSSTISPDQNNNRSWSTKHLSATGRTTDSAVRASRLVGAQVNDSNGQRAGQIQDIIVNPESGRIDFALLSPATTGSSQTSTATTPGATAGSSEKLVPVPWSLLRARTSAQYGTASEQPMFTLNADRSKLNDAPTVDWANLNQSEWRQRIYSYYGVTPQSSMGGADSPEGEIKGEGAGKLQPGTPPQPPQSNQ